MDKFGLVYFFLRIFIKKIKSKPADRFALINSYTYFYIMQILNLEILNAHILRLSLLQVIYFKQHMLIREALYIIIEEVYSAIRDF